MDNVISAAKAAIIEAVLEGTAERLGDITEQVIARTYAKCPAAKASFEFQSVWNITALEGRMVEETLLCVMNWYENPAQAQLVLQDTIPHHVDTFDIPLDQFYSVFEGLFDVVAQNIPQDESAQIDAWQTLMDEMRAYIHSDAVL